MPPVGAYQAQLAAYKAHDLLDRLLEIRAPALVLIGDSDVLVPPENSRILVESISGAELRVIEGAGSAPGAPLTNERQAAWKGEVWPGEVITGGGNNYRENIIKAEIITFTY